MSIRLDVHEEDWLRKCLALSRAKSQATAKRAELTDSESAPVYASPAAKSTSNLRMTRYLLLAAGLFMFPLLSWSGTAYAAPAIQFGGPPPPPYYYHHHHHHHHYHHRHHHHW